MLKNKKKLEELEFDFDDLNENTSLSNNKDDIVDETFDDFTTSIKQESEVHKIWLDTESYLNRLNLGLTNRYIKKVKYKNADGDDEWGQVLEDIPNTKPLANTQGVNQIMSKVGSIISKDIVQANLETTQYDNFMYSFKIKTKKMIITNRPDWEISINDIEVIYELITDAVTLFLTRPIGNLERDRDKTNNYPIKDDTGFLEKIGDGFKKKRTGRN